MKRSSLTSKQLKSPRIGIVVSKFNDFISHRLLKACLAELRKRSIPEKNITSIWVPGSFEVPVTAMAMAERKDIDAVICLGAVIRGDTYHFQLVADNVAKGIMKVSLETGKPVIMGVLSTDTVDQAYKRSDEHGDNKGRDAAITALEMINVLSQIKK